MTSNGNGKDAILKVNNLKKTFPYYFRNYFSTPSLRSQSR